MARAKSEQGGGRSVWASIWGKGIKNGPPGISEFAQGAQKWSTGCAASVEAAKRKTVKGFQGRLYSTSIGERGWRMESCNSPRMDGAAGMVLDIHLIYKG